MKNVKKLLFSTFGVVMLVALLVCVLVMPVSAEETAVVAKIGDVEYVTLQAAFNDAQDGDIIYIQKDIIITSEFAGYTDGTYVDGVRYTGDKDFTVDFGGYTITDDGCVNDYLIYLNNKGTKSNEITFLNGTISSAKGCWATVCVNSDAATQKSVVNLDGMTISNTYFGNNGHQAVRARKGATINLNSGTSVISDGASNAVSSSSSTAVINVNNGAKLIQKNSKDHEASDYVGAAASGTGIVNIYEGASVESDRFGLHTSTSGTPVFNIYGGTITANSTALKASVDYATAVATINVYGGTITGAIEERNDSANIWIYGGTFVNTTVDALAEFLPAGAAVKLDESGTVVPSEDAVAAIGNLGYLSLQDAVNSFDKMTVTLLSNIELTEMVTVASGKSVTLELNGKILSGVSSEAAASAVIENKGSLTIQNSVGDGKITSNALNPDKDWGGEGESEYPTYANNTINNYGALTLLSGTIENATDYSGATYAIDNYSSGSISVQGGKVVHNKGVAIRQYANSTTGVNAVAISGGTVESMSRAVWLQLPGSDATVAPKASLNINGGTLISNDTEYNHAVYVYSYGNSAANTTLRVTAGTINGDVAINCNGLQLNNLAVTGGAFNGNYGIYGYTALPGAFITGGSFKYIYDTTLVAADHASDVKVGDYYVVHKHNSDTIVEETPATCTTGGTEAGTKCSVCGENKIGFAPIGALDHDWSTDYQPGTDTHWNYCKREGCNAKQNEASHIYGEKIDNVYILSGNECAVQYFKSCNTCGKGHESDTFWVKSTNPTHAYNSGVQTVDPTCEATGVMTYTCTNAGCGHTMTESVSALTHDNIFVEEKSATCTANGRKAYYDCTRCEKVFLDKDGKNETTLEALVIPAAHTEEIIPAVAATCTQKGKTEGKKCSVCGTVIVPQTETSEIDHTWSEKLEHDASKHYYSCTNPGCTEHKDEAWHTYQQKVAEDYFIASNDCATGYYMSCSGCGMSSTSAFWIAKENPVHVWSEKYVYRATAQGNKHWQTCTNEGCAERNNFGAHVYTHSDDLSKYSVMHETECGTVVYLLSECDICGFDGPVTAAQKKVYKDGAVHAFGDGVVTKEAVSCDEPGEITYTCEYELCGFKKTEPITIPHTEEIIPAVAATCTKEGLTEGKKCSVCGTVTVEQKAVTKAAHTEEVIPAVAATCTKEGLTEGKKCSVCGTVTVEQKVVAKAAHTEEIIPAVAATCTKEGLTEGKKCSVCGTVTVEQTAVAALSHTLKKVDAKEATYTAPGNIEHYICSACSKLFADAEGNNEITDVVIPQLIKIEGTTAKVETGAVDNAITDAVEKAESTGTKAEVVIEVEKAAEPDDSTESEKPVEVEKVVEVQLPVQSIDKVVEAEAELTVVMPNATVTVDTEALKAVSEQAAGEAVTLKVEEVKHEELTVVQQKAVEKYDVAVTITAELVCQTTGEKIWTEDSNKAVESGSITVKLPFTPAENTNGSDYQVLYIADNGAVVEIETDYVDGCLVFSLEHFSDYVVVNTAAKAYPDSPATGDNANIVLLAIVAILSVAGLAVCIILARKNRYIPKH